MKEMGKTAIVLGATGLTGSILLQKLLINKRYNSIKVFTRKPTGIKHPKIIEIECDLLKLEESKNDFAGDEVYCCIGTTSKKTPDKKIYKQIDFGIPVSAAKLCKENKISKLLIISSIGANAKSSVFYSKTKGEMEQAVLALKISNTYILQPSFIVGDRKEKRTGEKFGIVLSKLVQPLLIGPAKKYRAINADTIANAMIYLANNGFEKQIVSSEELQKIGKSEVSSWQLARSIPGSKQFFS